ncbi:MAG: histidinol-phosphatase [Persephonella sp.]|nr:MAG: histidinol-phosphatase [Persephonella sp.]
MITIFDVDGVLFDASKSYHIAIWETVKHFTGKNDIEKKDLLDIKFKLGINNDWDVSIAGIIFVKTGLPLDKFIQIFKDFSKTKELMYQFAKNRNITLPRYEDLIKFFDDVYILLRENEEMIISKSILEEIRKITDVMGVITGRPFELLDFSFKKFNLYHLFDHIITDDDTPLSNQKKPSSYPLKLFFKKFEYREPVVYIGDTLADKNMVYNFNREENKNVNFVLFDNSHSKIENTSDMVVKTGVELLDLLNSIKEKVKA